MSAVTVVAPSRLHFGLYGFGRTAARQFGGIGAMIASPSVQLRASAAEDFQVFGPLADRVHTFAERWMTWYGKVGELPQSRFEILAAPPEHSGLGVGTQLGLSVAAALNALYQLPPVSPAELAQSVNRAQRSAVGTYGFIHGGLIAERGKLPSEPLSPLDVRLALPEHWRFVLITPPGSTGLAGSAEVQAFDQLPPVPETTTKELIRLAGQELLPAAAQADFLRFSQALYQYCHLAGLCFAAVQGGPYNGPLLTRLVQTMRDCGATAVGQSSWGPTLFALLPSEADAQRWIGAVRERAREVNFTGVITAPSNSGARITPDGAHENVV